MLNPIEEITFWTGIMRDHGEFILDSLSYNEQEAIYSANFYKEAFSKLHEQSMEIKEAGTSQFNYLVNESTNLLANFINFKRLLLQRSLKCQLNSSLPPTFFNHMINEALQFYKVLLNINAPGENSNILENIELLKVWLPDAAGHAATIADDLDPLEKVFINEAESFEKSFRNLSMKADELGKMIIRAELSDGVLLELNNEVKIKINEFITYLAKIMELRASCRILGILKPLIPNHMIREENYFLVKLIDNEQK